MFIYHCLILIPPNKLLCSSQLFVEMRPLVTFESRIQTIFGRFRLKKKHRCMLKSFMFIKSKSSMLFFSLSWFWISSTQDMLFFGKSTIRSNWLCNKWTPLNSAKAGGWNPSCLTPRRWWLKFETSWKETCFCKPSSVPTAVVFQPLVRVVPMQSVEKN